MVAGIWSLVIQGVVLQVDAEALAHLGALTF